MADSDRLRFKISIDVAIKVGADVQWPPPTEIFRLAQSESTRLNAQYLYRWMFLLLILAVGLGQSLVNGLSPRLTLATARNATLLSVCAPGDSLPLFCLLAKARQVQRTEIIEQFNLRDLPEPSFEPYRVYIRQGLCPELLTLTFKKFPHIECHTIPRNLPFPTPLPSFTRPHHASKGTGFTGSKLAILASSDIGP